MKNPPRLSFNLRGVALGVGVGAAFSVSNGPAVGIALGAGLAVVFGLMLKRGRFGC